MVIYLLHSLNQNVPLAWQNNTSIPFDQYSLKQVKYHNSKHGKQNTSISFIKYLLAWQNL